MINRIAFQNKKVNKNRKKNKTSFELRNPQAVSDYLLASKEHGKYKGQEGVIYLFVEHLLKLYTDNGCRSVTFYQSELARQWGIHEKYLYAVTGELKKLGIITKTYRNANTGNKELDDQIKEQRKYEPVTFSITKMMRDIKMQSIMTSLFPFLAPIAFSFFCHTNSFAEYRDRYLLHWKKKPDLTHIKHMEYNIIIKEEPTQKRDENISSSSNSSPPLEKNLLKPENVARSSVPATGSFVPRFQRDRSPTYYEKNGVPNPYAGHEPVAIKSFLDTFKQINPFGLAQVLHTTEKERPEGYEQY